MSLTTIKAAIKTNLDELVTAETLGGVTMTDIKLDPLNSDIGSFPHAFLMPPAVESEVLDNRSVVRTYTFDVLILVQAEDLDTTSELETLMEAVLDKFDNDPTLSGTAQGGVLPITSAPEPFQHGGRDRIYFVLQLQAKDVKALSFS